MNSTNQTPIVNIFEKAARKAGKALLRDFGEIENLQIETKGMGDFVTNADLKSEKIILETLTNYFPNATYISEEKGKIEGNDEIFIIDPIDGTNNFIHGIPIIGIVISKIINDEITDGIVFNPITNEFFWSSKGKGAWCNNKRLRVSKRYDFDKCLISTSFSKKDSNYDRKISIANNCSGIRNMGSAALDLAYVASGKIDGYFEKNLNLWDVSSGVLLVKEAGGTITEQNGSPWNLSSKDILASNSSIHENIVEKLK